MADHRRLLLLSVRAALGACGDDACSCRMPSGITATGVASMAGLFYWGYSPFSLVAGAALDRLGPARVVPIGAAAVGRRRAVVRVEKQARCQHRAADAEARAACSPWSARPTSPRRTFPASRAATLIGATQMFGMAGGSAGQFVVGPLIAAGMAWSVFWAGMGIAGGSRISLVLFLMLPAQAPSAFASEHGLGDVGARARRRVPQSAVDPLRSDRGPAVHPDDDLRHDLGRPLSPGSARPRTTAPR